MLQSHLTTRRMVAAFVALVFAFGWLAAVAAPVAAGEPGAPLAQSDGIASHREMITHNADGSVTKDTWYKGGAQKRETTYPDGSSRTTTTSGDKKTTVTVTTDANGGVTVEKTP